MLFGRQPRTLLDMLAEQWEETKEEVKDLLTYTRDLRENLHPVWEEAHTALREAQTKQKQIYDARSAVRTLAVGDKALVLLTSTENKLLARCQGPFDVIAQINPTIYRLATPQGTGREQIYHINLLKKWLDPHRWAFRPLHRLRCYRRHPISHTPYPRTVQSGQTVDQSRSYRVLP
ncbi:hypothetical protein NDU88_011509 [Pleurodeles waltl]|uniref:Tf2-1-like SH3-like domain-containing protein n=1 Tax=Pleurodeles waltl TaxID=8319 RepID=A0AAV7R396_PLEWA|nr:hypothetical protein NDU88_011509 [Pleurodeles waltl]